MNQNQKNNDTQSSGSLLAYAALDEVPTPGANAQEIVGLVKQSGRVTGYQLSDGRTVSKEDGVAMAKAGEFQCAGIAHRKDTENLKSLSALLFLFSRLTDQH